MWAVGPNPASGLRQPRALALSFARGGFQPGFSRFLLRLSLREEGTALPGPASDLTPPETCEEPAASGLSP